MVAALFSEACSNGSALFLNDGSLVGNSLGGANVADELLHWRITWVSLDNVGAGGGALSRTGTHVGQKGSAHRGPTAD